MRVNLAKGDSLSFTVTGQPYVKKSNQKVQWRGRRQVKVNTPSYNRWLKSCLEQLEDMGYNRDFAKQNKQLKELNQPLQPATFSSPINLQCRFFVATNGRVDLSALYEGIQDVLVQVGVLEDDNWHVVASHDGSGVRKDADNPRIEITIMPKEDV